MAAKGLRRVLQRSLPALLVILMALVATPQRPGPGQRPTATHAAAAAEAASERPDPGTRPTPAPAPAVADRTATLSTQFTAGVRGSRAPPSVSA